MITDIVIEDYQAIRKASLRLGRLTVVTGPTGSGKSAVVRAMKLVAFNARGTSYVRHGARQCQAALGFQDENLVVTITRGGRGADAYRIVWHEGGPAGYDDRNGVQFTKLAGAVPDEVQQELKLGPINFAGQFDRPYLLADSGSQVARTLGELTNVTLVLDAAREANRRKQEVTRELRSYEDMLRAYITAARRFSTLRDRRDAAEEASDRLDSALYIEDCLAKLYSYRDAQAELQQAESQLTVLSAPSLGKAEELQARLARLRTLDWQYRESVQAASNWERAEAGYARDEDNLHQQLHDVLVAAGTCPTCGRSM